MASVGTRAAAVGLLTLVAVACGGSDKETSSYATPFDHASALLLEPPRQASCHPQAPREQTDDEDPGGFTIYSFTCGSEFELHDTRLNGIASVKDNDYGDGFHHVIDVFTKMGCIKVAEVATMSDPAISSDTEHLAGDGATTWLLQSENGAIDLDCVFSKLD